MNWQRSRAEQTVDTLPRPAVDDVGTEGVTRFRAGPVWASLEEEVAFPQLPREGHLRLDAFGRVRVDSADEHDDVGLRNAPARLPRPSAVDCRREGAGDYRVGRVATSLRKEAATKFVVVVEVMESACEATYR